jgi:hypothetical protein
MAVVVCDANGTSVSVTHAESRNMEWSPTNYSLEDSLANWGPVPSDFVHYQASRLFRCRRFS